MEREEIARKLNDLMIDAIKASGRIRTRAVEDAFRSVLRHHFLPAELSLGEAYSDNAIVLKRSAEAGIVRIGAPSSSSTMPGLLASMLEAARLRAGLRVLQIGTGPGYLAALIGHLISQSGHVVTVEIDEDIGSTAVERISALGLPNVSCIIGDGVHGHAALAPYDRIMVTAACADVPASWVGQLTDSGLLLLPLSFAQRCGHCPVLVFRKEEGVLVGRIVHSLAVVGFLPLYGENVHYPVLFEQRFVGLEQKVAARLYREGYRQCGSDTLHLLAMIYLAEAAQVHAAPDREIDLERIHARASGFLSSHPLATPADFTFRLADRGDALALADWRFTKAGHDLHVRYEGPPDNS